MFLLFPLMFLITSHETFLFLFWGELNNIIPCIRALMMYVTQFRTQVPSYFFSVFVHMPLGLTQCAHLYSAIPRQISSGTTLKTLMGLSWIKANTPFFPKERNLEMLRCIALYISLAPSNPPPRNLLAEVVFMLITQGTLSTATWERISL